MSELERILTQFKVEFGEDFEEDLDQRVGGWDFLERVLFSLVRAYPLAGQLDVQRVSRAMRALTGTTMIAPREQFDDEALILDIAHAHASDLWRQHHDPRFKPRKITVLARTVVAGGTQDRVTVDRLCRKFGQKKRELLENVERRAIAIEVVQRVALEELEATLSKFGIKFHAYE